MWPSFTVNIIKVSDSPCCYGAVFSKQSVLGENRKSVTQFDSALNSMRLYWHDVSIKEHVANAYTAHWGNNAYNKCIINEWSWLLMTLWYRVHSVRYIELQKRDKIAFMKVSCRWCFYKCDFFYFVFHHQCSLWDKWEHTLAHTSLFSSAGAATTSHASFAKYHTSFVALPVIVCLKSHYWASM